MRGTLGEKPAAIQSLGTEALKDATIEKVELLGYGEIKFVREAGQLTLTLPEKSPSEYAVVFKISGKGIVAEKR